MVKVRARDFATVPEVMVDAPAPVVVTVQEPVDLSEVYKRLDDMAAAIAKMQALVAHETPDYKFVVQRDMNNRITSVTATPEAMK